MAHPLQTIALAAQIIALNNAPKVVDLKPQPNLKKIMFEAHNDSKKTRTNATPLKKKLRRNVRSSRQK